MSHEDQRPWEQLTTVEQRALLEMDSAALAKRFQRPMDFFSRAKKFYKDLPQQTKAPVAKEHSPPKDLILSARRDLSFYEANFELFDNSIDEWRKRGAKKDLHIHVYYDLDLLTGKYVDDAGGMEEKDVFRVFIPGETTNRDFAQNVIGSFGMGAKKGIFALTDGAKIISCPDGIISYTSEVPEKWEEEPSWETRDGRASPMRKGTTELFFFKLFKPPTLAEINELRERTGRTYAPLLAAKLGEFGKKPNKHVHITINSVEAIAPPDINWSSPKGAEPRAYQLSHVFRDFLSQGHDIELSFIFYCGLTRRLPGTSEDAEPDFGIDVYGNGRLIERFLKNPFGWATTGMSKEDQASKFVRGQLFILGHSFAIPWDTHKREYLADHPVAQWLRQKLRPIIKSYKTVASVFQNDTELRNKVLATTKPPADTKPSVLELPVGEDLPEEYLPKRAYKSTTSKSKGKPDKSSVAVADTEEESQARLAESVDGERTVNISLPSGEYAELMDRFEASTSEELETVIRQCLTGGVAFTLTTEQLSNALKTFRCDGDVGELSEIIRNQLLKKLHK